MPGQPIVVLTAAPGAVPGAVRDVLRDWVALGLVQPFLWVEAEEVSPDEPFAAVVATHVRESDAPRVRLQDHLANQHDVDVIRLVAVGSAGASTSLVDRDRAGFLNIALAGVTAGRVSALQCVLTRHGAGGWQSEVERPGWHTLVVAPEDAFSPSPRQPTTELIERDDDAEFMAHAAAGVATASGLWSGLAEAPFDDVPVTGNPEPVVVRSFLRRLDASAVESRLRQALTDVSRGLPRPRSGAERCDHMQNPVAASNDMATRVLTRHAALFAVQEEPDQGRGPEPLGAWQAIKMFFAFVGAALNRAPRALADAVVGRAAAGTARRVQQALLGGDSRYEVVVRGVNASGLPAGVHELDAAAVDVRQRVAAILHTSEQALPDVAPFWQDVVGGALTLADAGDRGPDLAPVMVGSRPTVARDTSTIAPDPADTFPLRGPAANRLRIRDVPPHDFRLHDVVARELSAAAAEDVGSAQAVSAFSDWRRRVSSTYTGGLGAHIGNEVERRGRRLAQLLELLLGAQEESTDEGALADEHRRVQRLLRNFVIGMAVGLVVGVLVVVLGVLGVLTVVLIGLALLSAGTVRTVLALLARQRAVFALAHRRTETDRHLEIASRNLAHAANALHVATTLYQQYLAWSSVLGAFLREPFGPVPPVQPVVRLEGLLPRAVGFGVAEPVDERIAEVAHALGAVMFERGWLSDLWQAFYEDAGRRLGSAGLVLRDEPRALLSDRARDEDSLLVTWAAAVQQDGVTGDAGDRLWQAARGRLLMRGADALCSSLFTRVEVQAQQDHGITRLIDGSQFFTQLSDALDNVGGQAFSPSLFSPTATSQGLHLVTATVAVGRRDVVDLGGAASAESVRWIPPSSDGESSLDLSLVVLQATAPVSASELRLSGGTVGRTPISATRAGDADGGEF